MKLDALKLKINRFAYDLIDDIFPKRDLITNIGNATSKFYIDQNMYRLDIYLRPFADSNGDIDTARFMTLLDENVFTDDRIKINISQYLPEEVRRFLPKEIVVNRDDFVHILKKEGS